MTWRNRFAPTIREIISKHKGEPENVIRKALRDWWDERGLGLRAHHPYKIFLDEIKRQLGLKPHKRFGEKHRPALGQSSMFEGCDG